MARFIRDSEKEVYVAHEDDVLAKLKKAINQAATRHHSFCSKTSAKVSVRHHHSKEGLKRSREFAQMCSETKTLTGLIGQLEAFLHHGKGGSTKSSFKTLLLEEIKRAYNFNNDNIQGATMENIGQALRDQHCFAGNTQIASHPGFMIATPDRPGRDHYHTAPTYATVAEIVARERQRLFNAGEVNVAPPPPEPPELREGEHVVNMMPNS